MLLQNPSHLVVIGGGPAGYVAALHAAAQGARVTLIEADGLGGTCLHRGCIPTKTLASTCALLDKLSKAQGMGIRLGGEVSVQWPELQGHMRGVVGTVAGGVASLLADRKVEVVKGRARLVDSRTVEVAGRAPISGDYLLVCTGSKPARPPVFPLDDEHVVTSDELLMWNTLPQSLVIVGEGVIACEFAFILNALGVKVTIVGMEERPLPMLDTDISAIVAREMRKKKIQFIGAKLVEMLELRNGQVEVYAGGAKVACAERALVCVGRVANTAAMGLADAQVKTGARGEIIVDHFMRTSAPGVYAAGDVTGRVMLAHAASAQAKLAVDHMFGRVPRIIDETMVPLAIFTSPEIGSVGLTERAAGILGIEVACGKFDIRGLGRAQAMGELAGLAKIVADAKTGRVLGAHLIGPHATDMVHEAAVAMRHEATVDDLIDVIHAHPTLSEALVEASEDVFGQATHKMLKTKEKVLS